MKTAARSLWIILATLLIALATSCGGGSSKNSNAPATGTPDPLLSDPAAALRASAERLKAATAGRAEFDWQVKNPGFNIQGNGTYLVAAPHGFQIEAHYEGKGDTLDEASDSDLLVMGQTAYLKTLPYGDKWVVFTAEELGPEWPYVQNLLAARSPLDYNRTIEGLIGDITDLGMDGSYTHLRTIIDAGDLLEALAAAYESQGQEIFGGRFDGPVQIDIWLDPVTLLPHAVDATGSIQFENEPTDVTLHVDYSDINGDVALPPVPTDTIPATAVLGG